MGASAATSDRQDIIPASMDELARHYYDFILGMVRKYGIPDQEAADSVQYILERLEKTDVLAQYDPEHLTEHQGRNVRTRFSTFLGAKVIRYCLGERGKLLKRASHELLIVDTPASTSGDGTSLVELLGADAEWDDYSGVEAQEFIARMRAHLAAVPPRSTSDTCDLVALFDELAREVEQTGAFTYAGIQARFGVSGTTAGAWLSRLRKVLRDEPRRPAAVKVLPAAPRGPAAIIGGVALTAEGVAAAVKVLRDAPGIMVAQPLAKAGHPLAKAAKGWYHSFSKAELKKFPGIVLPPGSRRGAAGNGHVKEAVLHRLERILAESGVPAPELPAPVLPPEPDPEPVTPEEEFEAELWHYLRDAGDMDRIKALARRAYEVSPA